MQESAGGARLQGYSVLYPVLYHPNQRAGLWAGTEDAILPSFPTWVKDVFVFQFLIDGSSIHG